MPMPSSGSVCRAAFSGPRRYSRTLEFAPSAPTMKLPVTAVPSSKCAVTEDDASGQETLLRRFPYFEHQALNQQHNLERSGVEMCTWMSTSNAISFLNFDLASLRTLGDGNSINTSPVFPFNIGNISRSLRPRIGSTVAAVSLSPTALGRHSSSGAWAW